MDTELDFDNGELAMALLKSFCVCCPECGDIMDYEYEYDDYYYCDNDDCKFYRVVRLMD